MPWVYMKIRGFDLWKYLQKELRNYRHIKGIRSRYDPNSHFVEKSLTSAEKQLLNELIDNSWERYINRAKVVLSALTQLRYVEGLSLFAHRLREAADADVAVCVVSMGQRTYIVARSKEEILNVSGFGAVGRGEDIRGRISDT